MAILVDTSLKLIFNVLSCEIENTQLPSSRRLELTDLLKTLNACERILVAKYFCKLSWNIGSLNILSILQELGILTAAEYILSYENFEEVQLILNDFLEAKFELLCSILINAAIDSSKSLRLNALLEDCFESLLNDLLLKPELNDLHFLKYVKNAVPTEVLLKVIHKFLSSTLSLCQTNIKEAFSNFSSWINEGVDEIKFTKDLYKELLCEHIEVSLNFLLKSSSVDNFREWKFYLILLQTISSSNNELAGPYIRKHLKLYLKQCAVIPCKRSIMHLLLTARAATATTTDITKNLNNYAEWYKNNIGEMKFFLPVEEFKNILNLLDQCIYYEMETDYIEIHTIVIISPPVLCGHLVKTYKSKCKQRLQQIKKGNLQVDARNESIIIEDSD